MWVECKQEQISNYLFYIEISVLRVIISLKYNIVGTTTWKKQQFLALTHYIYIITELI